MNESNEISPVEHLKWLDTHAERKAILGEGIPTFTADWTNDLNGLPRPNKPIEKSSGVRKTFTNEQCIGALEMVHAAASMGDELEENQYFANERGDRLVISNCPDVIDLTVLYAEIAL